MPRILISASLILTLLGCSSAQKSSEVQAVRAPIAPYLKMTCKELVTEQTILIKDSGVATNSVDSSYDSDKNAELVTWILFAPAAFALEGNQAESAKLAAIKGQLESVQEALKINKCLSN